MKIGDKLPEVNFQTRVRDEAVGGPNPYRWEKLTTSDFFKGKTLNANTEVKVPDVY